jgi:phosphoenolpyruvate-protein phosphotransferase/dihydroxyacetone kinase phosphotransfer subunit
MSGAESRVGLVLVSHSRALAEATETLARQMTGSAVVIVCAAGAGEGGAELGTNPVAIAAALERACGPAGAVVLMDLGSAILSAETALDLVDPAIAARSRLSEGPLVEGAIAAAVRAAAGGSLAEVAAEARQALAAKAAELVETESPAAAAPAPSTAAVTVDAVVADRNGLHARPAARLVKGAMDFDASVTVENVTAGRGPVRASSLTALVSLDARHGHVLRLRATGRQAAEAAAALAVLVQRSREAAAPAALAAPGFAIPVAPGVGFGPLVRLVRTTLPIAEDKVDDPKAEAERLRRALDKAALDIADALVDSDVCAAHLALLRDPAILDQAFSLVDGERCNAAFAFHQAIEAGASVFARLDDAYLRARESDLRDVGGAVLRALFGSPAATLPDGPPAVVVADNLALSEAARLDTTRVLGVIDRRGGPTSHASILLRGAGIPAVAGAAALVPEAGGVWAGLDGTTGEVWVDPDPATAAEIERRQVACRATRRASGARRGCVRLTCGREIELWANIAGVAEARAARDAGAAGVGVLRTEMLFLDRREAPSEAEQAALLAEIFAAFGAAPIIVRTLDAGGDKVMPYFERDPVPEANPSLGVRGIRLSLERPAVFEAQLRAILSAGCGRDVRIMFPMITTAAEIVEARAALERAHRVLDVAGRPHLWPVTTGIMIEVPAAALMAPRLAREADFFSLGTNDLTQYVLAAERGHPRLHALADAAHPAVLQLVGAVAEAGRAASRPVSVCGEAAADPVVAALLVGLGVTTLSMGVASFGAVQGALGEASFAALAAAAREALAAGDAEAARAAVRRRGG